MECMGFSPLSTGNFILISNLGFIVGGPFFGALSDNLFKTRKWIVLPGLGSLLLLMLVFAFLPPGAGLLSLGGLFFAFGFFGSAGMVMYAQIKELMPAEMAGTAMGGINFFAFLGGAAFLHGLGNVMQYFYPQSAFGQEAFKTAFLICAACLAVVFCLYLFTKDTRGK